MKRSISAICVASLLMFSNSAFAQSFSGSGSATGTLTVEQSAGPLPCDISIPVTGYGSHASSTTGASSSSPVLLCNIYGNTVDITGDWNITDLGVNPFDSKRYVLISNITANSFLGHCGPGSVVAEVLSSGPPLTVYIPRQAIDGWVPPFPPGTYLPCYIEGVVTISGVSL